VSPVPRLSVHNSLLMVTLGTNESTLRHSLLAVFLITQSQSQSPTQFTIASSLSVLISLSCGKCQ